MQDIQPDSDASSQKAFMRTKRTPKVKQACDCCHARKIKCDGQNPCNNCTVTKLACTYLSVPKKKGPKGPSKRTPRAVLKMQAEQQQRSQAAQPSVQSWALPPSRSSTMSSTNSYDHAIYEQGDGWQHPVFTTQETAEPTPSSDSHDFVSYRTVSGWQPSPLLTLDIAKQFVEFFFEHKYCTTPILHQDSFRALLPTFQSWPSTYALVSSLCASLAAQMQPHLFSSDNRNSFLLSTDFFIAEAKRARVAADDYIENPALADVHTSFFIFAGFFDLDRHNSAWFYLREAISLMESLRLHEEESYTEMNPQTALYSRRTFWLLFVSEHDYALQRHLPLTLNPTIDLPSTSPEDPDDEIICGFLDLVAMFQNFDSNFVSSWNLSSRSPALRRMSNGTIDPARRESAVHFARLQSKLASALPFISAGTEIQKADLTIRNLWLQTTTWQLQLARGHLTSAPNLETLSFTYPVSIARNFAAISSSLSPEAFDANGPGILAKVFDIGCALTDVVSVRPERRASMEVGPQEYLGEMLRVMSVTKAGHRYRGLLMNKAEECFGDGLMVIGHLNRADTNLSTEEQRVTEIEVVDEKENEAEMVSNTERETTHPSSGTSQALFSEAWAIGDDGKCHGVLDTIVEDAPISGTDEDEEMYDMGNLGHVSTAWLQSMESMADEGSLSIVDAPSFGPPKQIYYT